MTEEQDRLLYAFDEKLKIFMSLYRNLEKENAELREQLKEKEAELFRIGKSKESLEVMYENLKSARMISINDKDIADTKQRLARLVREVDKCIALLNE